MWDTIMTWLAGLLGIDAATLGIVLVIAMGLNIALGAAQKVLELFMDKTPSDSDNKAYALIGKVLEVLHKVMDWLGGNRSHS